MKVLHLCLGNFYIDNYSYQENMLTKYHKKLGLNVEIIASLVSFDENGKTFLLNKGGTYINENSIPVTRLEYKKTLASKRLRRYSGTYNAIEKAKPNIIFIHGCQFMDIDQVVKYAERNPEVIIYVDNHADFSNSARNWLSKNILHKKIWRKCAHLIEPFTKKFYGVLPARVDFLRDMYKLPKDKIELLLMGADDVAVSEAKKPIIREDIRNKYNINDCDFLIISGGKIDNAKRQTLFLLEAVKEINNPNIKLIIFGSIVEELKDEVLQYVDGDRIQYIGWVSGDESYKYFASADLAVFPGRHSVYWEQVAGLGVPMIVKHWEGTTHVDLEGNCKFLYKDSTAEIKYSILDIVNNKFAYNLMCSSAQQGMSVFSYEAIAKKSIDYPKL